jgi:transposase
MYDGITVGLDLGDRWSEVCVLDAESEVVRRAKVRTTNPALTEEFRGRPRCRVVLEVGTHSPWVSRLLDSLGHEVVVANPRNVKLVYAATRKNDRNDAERLARLGRADPKLLSPVSHRGVQMQVVRATLRARAELVACRTPLVALVRGQVKSLGGERLPMCSAESFHRRVAKLLPPELEPALTPVLEAIGSLTTQIGALDDQIEILCRDVCPAAARLRQVPGVGPVTSLAFVATIEDPSRFPDSRRVGAYLGLVPRQDQTGGPKGKDRQPRISKAGDSYVRQLLVQCAHYVLGPFGPETDLRRWGEEVQKTHGGNGKRKAVVAVARKLAVLLHRLWVTGEDYVPIRHSAPRAAA